MATPLTAAKQQLRKAMKQKLSAVSHESVQAQSRQVFETLQDFQPYRDARRISIYLSMPAAEVQTDAIVRDALATGKQVFVPYLHRSSPQSPDTPSRVMDMVRLHSASDYENLVRDRWGIPSVDPNTVHERQRLLGGHEAQGDVGSQGGLAGLDLMLLPGVAFDMEDGDTVSRLGHGRGFYDFFLNRYYASNPEPVGNGEGRHLLLYGLALKEQLVSAAAGEAIPLGPYDRSLHGLVVGDGSLRQASTTNTGGSGS